MIEYRIVEAAFVDELEQAVNDAIAEGWRPLGGIIQHGKVITPGESGITEGGTHYTALPQTVLIVAQAMTREKKAPPVKVVNRYVPTDIDHRG